MYLSEAVFKDKPSAEIRWQAGAPMHTSVLLPFYTQSGHLAYHSKPILVPS